MVESEVTVNKDAVLAWLETGAVEQGKTLSDLDQGIFGGETIAEEIAGLVCRTERGPLCRTCRPASDTRQRLRL